MKTQNSIPKRSGQVLKTKRIETGIQSQKNRDRIWILILIFFTIFSNRVFSQNTFLNNLKSAAGFGMLSGHDIIIDSVNSVDGWLGAVNKISIHPDSNNSNFNIANEYQVRDAIQNFNKVFLELQTEQGVIFTKTNTDTIIITPGTYRVTNGWDIGQQHIRLEGFPDDIFVFDITGDLVIGNNSIMDIGGIKPKNIFWAVTNNVSIGAHSTFFGNILTQKT